MDQKIENSTAAPVRLMPYIGWFSLWYGGLAIVLTAVNFTFGINLGRAASIAMLITAATLTGGRFVKDHAREFEGSERWKLAFWCLISAHLLSLFSALIVTMVVAGSSQLDTELRQFTNLPVEVWTFVLGLVSFFYYFAIALFLGLGVKNGLKARVS